MFMSAAPLTAETGAASGPQDQERNRYGRLLGLVRRIIDHGRDLVATLKRQNTASPSGEVARRFGTFNLTLIIARITRGLAIAAGLESRLLRARPAKRANPNRPARPARPRPKRPPVISQSEDDAALLRTMPSTEEIAERIRHRAPGAVIVEICRDLGIHANHPLWPEIRDAIILHDGSLASMVRVWMDRMSIFMAAVMARPSADWSSHGWGGPLPASTGPP